LRFAVDQEASRSHGAPCRDVPCRDVSGPVRADVADEGAPAPGERAGQMPGEVKRRFMSTGTSLPRRP